MVKKVKHLSFISIVVVGLMFSTITLSASPTSVPGNTSNIDLVNNFEIVNNLETVGGSISNDKILSSAYVSGTNRNVLYLADEQRFGTNGETHQQGVAWYRDKVDLTENFILQTSVYLGDSNTNASEGLVFTMQNDPRGLQAKGSAGLGMGSFVSTPEFGYDQVKNGVSVQIDTRYNNDAASSGESLEQYIGIPNYDYGAMRYTNIYRYQGQNYINGNPTSAYIQFFQNVNSYSTQELSDGKWRNLTIFWFADTNILSYILEDEIQRFITVDLSVVDPGNTNSAYWGFSSAGEVGKGTTAVAFVQSPTITRHTLTYQDEYNGNSYAYNINDGNYILEPCAPTRPGYVFLGWYKDSNFTTKWNFSNDTLHANTTLYALWERVVENHKVIFKSNGELYLYTTEQGDSLLTKPPNPTRVGYTFDGWYKDSQYRTIWNFETDKVNNTIILYAKWTKNSSPVKPNPVPNPPKNEGVDKDKTYTFTSTPFGGNPSSYMVGYQKGVMKTSYYDPITGKFYFLGNGVMTSDHTSLNFWEIVCLASFSIYIVINRSRKRNT